MTTTNPLSGMYKNPLPYDLEAEQGVLCSMFLDPKRIPVVREIVRDGCFYDERNARIYAALCHLYDHRPGFEPIEVVMVLKERQQFDAVGGDEYLRTVFETLPSAASAEIFARRVADKRRERDLIEACDRIVHRLLTNNGAETTDELAQFALERVAAAGKAESATADIRLADAEQEVLEQLGRQEAEVQPTGLYPFDASFGGLPRTGLVVLFGYTSSGKTTLTLQLALEMTKRHGRWTRVFSFEQPAKRVAATLLSADAGLQVHTLWNRGQLPTDVEWVSLRKTHAEHGALNFEIVEDNMHAAAIFSRCVAYREQHGAEGVVIVDYLQNLPPPPGAKEPVAQVAESMRWLQRISRDLGLLVLLVSQITREAGKSGDEPKLTDGLGGVAIESKADGVFAVYRPHLLEPCPADAAGQARWHLDQALTRLHLLKSKYGPKGVAEVQFNPKCMRFEEETPTWQT